MGALLAEMIHDLAETKERKEAKSNRVIFALTHYFTDEYGVTKTIYMFPGNQPNTWYLRYKSTTFSITRNDFKLVIDILLQNILSDFLEITRKQDSSDVFTADLDWIGITIYHNNKKIACCNYYFLHDIPVEDVQNIDIFAPNERLGRLSRYMTTYVAFSMYICHERALQKLMAIS